MSEPFIRYEIIDDKGVIYSLPDHDEAWEAWQGIKGDYATIPETFGDIKLVKVLDITR